jgi:hypothetical protein
MSEEQEQHTLRGWLEQRMVQIVLMAVLSILLYSFGLTLGLFLVPLQYLFERWGIRALVLSVVLSVIGIVLNQLIQVRQIEAGVELEQLWLSLLVPASMLAGLILMNIGRSKQPIITRIALVQISGGVILAPFVWNIFGEGPFREVMMLFLEGFESQVAEGSSSYLLTLMQETIVRTYGLGNLVMVLIGWFLGRLIADRQFRLDWAEKLSRFTVPGYWLWIFIVSGFSVLIDLQFNPGTLFGAIVWLVATCTGLILGLQGLGIIWAWIIQKRGGLAPRGGVLVLLVFGLLIPGVNIVISLGLPILGISEIWVTYKFRVKERKTHEGDS